MAYKSYVVLAWSAINDRLRGSQSYPSAAQAFGAAVEYDPWQVRLVQEESGNIQQLLEMILPSLPSGCQ